MSKLKIKIFDNLICFWKDAARNSGGLTARFYILFVFFTSTLLDCWLHELPFVLYVPLLHKLEQVSLFVQLQ